MANQDNRADATIVAVPQYTIPADMRIRVAATALAGILSGRVSSVFSRDPSKDAVTALRFADALIAAASKPLPEIPVAADTTED